MAFAGISAHQRIVAGVFDRVRRNVADVAAETELQVTLQSGAQAGIGRRMKVSELAVGAGQDNDLILLDDAAVDQHMHLRLERSAFGTLVSVQALGASVLVNGQELDAGEVLGDQSLPLVLTVGGTDLHLARPAGAQVVRTPPVVKEAVVNRFSWLWRYDPVLLTAFAGFLAVVFTAVLFGWTTSVPDHYVTTNTSVQPTPVRVARKVDWVSETESKMVEVGLDGILAVEPMAGGMLRMSGTLSEAKLNPLRDLQLWYDAQPGAPTMLWDVVRRPQLDSVPPIAMVRLSEPAAVFLSSGAEVRVGQILTGGWELSAVGADELELKQGNETVRVNLLSREPS